MTDAENVEVWSGKDRGDENFPVGSRLVARKYRPHIHAYYAFARNADDIADSPDLAPDDKIARLNHMEAVLLGKRDGGSPSALKLRESLKVTKIKPIHATELLIAFRMDALQNRYLSIDDLYNYCRYSAMPVGRYVLDLHREDSAGCYAASDALCMALQILNHLQDCKKDLLELDRCYLPLQLMEHFHTTIDDVRGDKETPELRRVFFTLLDRIDRMLVAAQRLPERVKDKRLKTETATIYKLAYRLRQKLGTKDPLARRVKLSKADFLFSGLAALRYRF